MNNPVLVELTRGGIIESVHCGSIAVVDADGSAVIELGSTRRPVFPRSAKKLIQALPLVESGAADAYGFGNKELALACASHSSEPGHVELAMKMLNAAGLEPDDLACGAHWPLIGEAGSNARIALAQSGGSPSALHNNCSGKHAGFLCCAEHSGMSTSAYINPDHELQREILAIMEDLTGEAIPSEQRGIDGCSAPTLAASLNGIAYGFAKLATGLHLPPERAKAAKRLMNASMAEPWFTAGTNRFCTQIMEIGGGRIFAKVGAEGVYAAAVPELGLGVALKADDGAERAAEMMLAAVMHKLLGQDGQIGAALTALTRREIVDWNSEVCGEMRSLPI